MNILFLNAGRRCELIESFRMAMRLRGGGLIHGSDISPWASGLQVTDRAHIFPHGDSAEFPEYLIDFCRSHSIGLVVPTIDPDLLRLDEIREAFSNELPDCRLLLSPSFTLRHASDKGLSKRLFDELGVETPKTLSPTDAGLEFPVFVKPCTGSAGIGARPVSSAGMLRALLEEDSELIVEQYIDGPEFTVDVLCDFQGKALIAIARKRIKVRAGEVEQGVVERSEELENLSMMLAEGFAAEGPVTLQFKKGNEGFVALELNARIGGGLPLSIAAGGHWPGWILDLCQGIRPDMGGPIIDGLNVTRCDRSFFVLSNKLPRTDARGADRVIEKVSLQPRLQRCNTWLFDLDDTIFPERDFVFGGYRAVAVKVFNDLGFDIEGDLRERFLTGERGDLFTKVLRLYGIDAEEEYVKTLVEIYRTNNSIIKPFVDVISSLSALRAKGRKIGLITDGWLEVQERKLDSLGIAALFDAVIFTDAIDGVKTWKPAPEGFLECLRRLDADPKDAVFVGDNPLKDFIGANQLGMATVRICRKGSEHEHRVPEDSSYEPDIEVSSLQELVALTAGAFK